MKKPSERIDLLYEASIQRYQDQDFDTRTIAALLNVIDLTGRILDEHEERIKKVEN